MRRDWYKTIDLQNFYLANKSTDVKNKMLEDKTYESYIGDLETFLTDLDNMEKQYEKNQENNGGSKKYHS